MDKERWQLIERTYHSALERNEEAEFAFRVLGTKAVSANAFRRFMVKAI